jgi:mono/diheme cytochrome c family protein
MVAMMGRWVLVVGVVMACAGGAGLAARQQTGAARPAGGWTVPPDAAGLANPLASDPKALATGKALYGEKCQRCHGPGGLGDGADADPDHREDMDLTNGKRAERNPDGVVFYKIWNGRSRPKMPAFKDELTKEQVWALVTYAQSLRRKP